MNLENHGTRKEDNHGTIEVIWQGQISSTKIVNLSDLDSIDLALLQLNSSLDHKYIDFDHNLQLTDKFCTLKIGF